MFSRGLLLHFYRQSRYLIQSVRVYIYIYTSIMSPLFRRYEGRASFFSRWHNRNSSSQEPSSLLFFAHSLTIGHLFHTIGMLLYYSILCGLTSALKSHTKVSLSRVSNDLRRRLRTLFALFTFASVCVSNFNFSSMMTPMSFSSVAASSVRSPIYS